MNKQENQKMMMVPPIENKGTMMLPSDKKGLIVPPTPMSREDMLKVSGGADEGKTPGIEHENPPEMKVVELKDGSFVNVPECAICKTEEEAKNFVMPNPPMPGEHHHPDHKHHGHKHHHNPFKPWL